MKHNFRLLKRAPRQTHGFAVLLFVFLLLELSLQRSFAQTVSNSQYTVLDGSGGGTGEYIRNLKYSGGPDWGFSFYVGSTKRMTIRGNNVGIGTDNPQKLLQVTGSSPALRLSDETVMYPGTQNETTIIHSAWDLNGGSSFSLSRGSDNLMALTIPTSTLNLGVGVSAPSTKIDAAGTIRARNGTSANCLEAGHSGSSGFINLGGVGNLDFRTSGTTRMSLTPLGRLGVGTEAPQYSLDVNGTINATEFLVGGQTLETVVGEWVDTFVSQGNQVGPLSVNTSQSIAGHAMTVAGAVHIGHEDDQDSLSLYNYSHLKDEFLLWVERGVVSEDFIVRLSNRWNPNDWPDYVFAEDYKLQSLREIEQFIKENKHLPDVPSANEIKENGYSTNGITIILLKKIEELMLHAIAQDKEILELKKNISLLNNK